ncbi:MAG: CoA pyrophosphatase [Flavobacteriia bacterium]|nr:CoA pyrophosphatase [Flavobacteriia bacterium]NBV91495.1 CoA pyrophosphatase [Flavobacteriia bacterium]NBY40752.1 CoA pyrophosphatase [Flavobacteriia bacterium]
MDFISILKKYENDESRHFPLLPFGKIPSSEARKNAISPRQAAVGIHLYYNENGHPEVILIKRTEYEGKHSGQIAFPGGKMEPEDLDLIATARRECFEEIGIGMNEGEYITQLTQVYIPISNFDMHPFVFYHDRQPVLTLNPLEVSEIIFLSLYDLTYTIQIIEHALPYERNLLFQKNVPGFDVSPHWIWGATALVLSELKTMFLEYSQGFE